jgi:DNA invertase Pin-like site-specific DNA recombinase
MKAIILARVSKEDQLDGASIPAQLARSQEYAKRKGLDVTKEYQFDESSSKSIG